MGHGRSGPAFLTALAANALQTFGTLSRYECYRHSFGKTWHAPDFPFIGPKGRRLAPGNPAALAATDSSGRHGWGNLPARNPSLSKAAIMNLRYLAACCVLGAAAGCTDVPLQRNTLNEAGAAGDIQTQQVLNNSAMFVCDPNAMPLLLFSDTNSASVIHTGALWAGHPSPRSSQGLLA